MVPLRSSITTVITAAAMAYRENMVPMVSFTSSCRFAPINWAIITVPPTARPLIRLITRMVTCPPTPTAEVPIGPLNCPTISISAMLYSACSRLEAKNGSENFSRCRVTLPSVRSFWNLLTLGILLPLFSSSELFRPPLPARGHPFLQQ